MVLAGLQELTQLSSWPAIWDALFRKVNPSGYQPGEKIALKVNFNNSGRDGNTCSQHNNLVDALPHPVLSLISGLVAAGVSTTNIIVYDATQQGRIIPSYFRDALTTAHPGVVFVGKADCTGVVGASHGAHPSLTVAFQDPDSILKTPRLLADVLYNVAYVINLPIVKVHGGNAGTPVSLGFKNHFGSINEVYGSGTNNLHEYVSVAFTHYKADYNPVVDIYKNPNVGPKTILTLGDGIFGGGSSAGGILSQWSTFGGPLRSLFFGVDPVATDCVMADFIVAEGLVNKTHTYDYLFCAEEAGLGVCEGTRQNPGGNPWQTPYGSGYSKITYVRKDIA